MKTKGLEETKLAGDVVLLPVRSLLPQQWVRLEIMGARACGEPGAGWPRQSFSYWGVFSGSLPGCCCLPGCRLWDLPVSPVTPSQCPGHIPAEVITSCRLKIHQQFEGIFLHSVPEIVAFCRSALIKSC